MAGSKESSISKADTLQKLGEFWDTHDFTNYDTDAPDVEFDVACAIPVDPELLSLLEEQARTRGVRVETLVNLWLQQKLDEQTKSVPAVAERKPRYRRR